MNRHEFMKKKPDPPKVVEKPKEEKVSEITAANNIVTSDISVSGMAINVSNGVTIRGDDVNFETLNGNFNFANFTNDADQLRGEVRQLQAELNQMRQEMRRASQRNQAASQFGNRRSQI